MPARACGTIRMARASVISTTSATTPSTISVAIGRPFLSVSDERRGAVDLDDLHAGTRLERLILVVGPRSPDLSADLYLTAVSVNAFHHRGGPAHQRGRAGADAGRRAQVTPGDWPQDQQRRERGQDEHDPACREPAAGERNNGRQRGSDRDRPQEEAHREDFPHGEPPCGDHPPDPVFHPTPILSRTPGSGVLSRAPARLESRTQWAARAPRAATCEPPSASECSSSTRRSASSFERP